MLILHISDIHFRKGEAGSALDPNHHLRTKLVRDAAQQCEKLDAVPGAVLVSGDIAYSGHPEEYAFAQTWFEELCDAIGCETCKIFVISGNHDVQRNVAIKPMVQAAHKDIKDTQAHLLNAKLSGYLNDEDNGKQLYGPLEDYNNFAGTYLCSLAPPRPTESNLTDFTRLMMDRSCALLASILRLFPAILTQKAVCLSTLPVLPSQMSTASHIWSFATTPILGWQTDRNSQITLEISPMSIFSAMNTQTVLNSIGTGFVLPPVPRTRIVRSADGNQDIICYNCR